MDFLIVLEADDGTWYDEPQTAVGLQQARSIARSIQPPRGYEATIYAMKYVETVEPLPAAPQTDK